MKKVLITLIVVVVYLNLTAQKMHTVAWYNWSNPVSYQLSPSPYITGYGYHSDSLSRAFDGTTFYEYNGEYYPIKTWADYYLWYVNKYWYNFTQPSLYEYYYHAEDNLGMASYITGRDYLGRYYPSRICVSFINEDVEINRLGSGSRYIASNEKKVKKLKRQIESKEEFFQKKHFKLAKAPSKNNHNLVYKKDIVKKPVPDSKKNSKTLYTKSKNNKQKTVKKEVKLNKYQHVNYRTNTNYRRSNVNATNSVNRSYNNSSVSRTSSVGRSSTVKNNSAKTKLPE